MSNTLESIETLKVCQDCYLTVGGYDSHELGYEPEYAPLSKLGGLEYYAEYDGDSEFSNYPCSGCASPLAGSRYPITIMGG